MSRGHLREAWFRAGPILVVLAAFLVVWYLAAIGLNASQVIERQLSDQPGWTAMDLVRLTLSMDRPVLPAPHQIALDMFDSIFGWPVDSPRSLIYHTAVTSSATLLGFVMGSVLGAVIAVLVVHSRTLERSFFPWVIASQTVPVLAIAPIVIVILGSMGMTGVFPK
ncbi:MAG: ABC transporter permease, partial [Caldimonas sp.]